MADSDLTHVILREIRDEIRSTNNKIDATNTRLDVTISRLDDTIDRLDGVSDRIGVMNERLTVAEHTVSDAAGQIVLLARYVKNKHENAIDDLRERVTRLEAKSNG